MITIENKGFVVFSPSTPWISSLVSGSTFMTSLLLLHTDGKWPILEHLELVFLPPYFGVFVGIFPNPVYIPFPTDLTPSFHSTFHLHALRPECGQVTGFQKSFLANVLVPSTTDNLISCGSFLCRTVIFGTFIRTMTCFERDSAAESAEHLFGFLVDIPEMKVFQCGVLW